MYASPTEVVAGISETPVLVLEIAVHRDISMLIERVEDGEYVWVGAPLTASEIYDLLAPDHWRKLSDSFEYGWSSMSEDLYDIALDDLKVIECDVTNADS